MSAPEIAAIMTGYIYGLLITVVHRVGLKSLPAG
jgi:hypothetical protein